MDELSRFACEADVATVITASIAELEKTTWPGLAQLVRNRLQAGDCDNEVPANCSQCEELLRGLHRAPGFAVSYPNKHTKACRDYVDRLVRQTFNNKSQISAMGYIMGRRRWKRCGAETCRPAAKRGRKCKRDDPDIIAHVEKALMQNSQDSSRVCFDRQKQEWVLVRTMCKDTTSVWREQKDELNLSLSTMRSILRRHLCNYKPPWVQSDMCVYCVDLRQKVLPQAQELVQTCRDKLAAVMDGYFTEFDRYSEEAGLAEKPGLMLREFQHFIWRHAERQPCRKHRGSGFPCGLSHMRSREAGLNQRQRGELHEAEAECCHKLREMSRLLDSYLFHRSANDHQKGVLRRVHEQPEPGHVAALSDFREQFTLPLRAVATGEEYYANARFEISIFGSVVTERAAEGSDDVLTTHVLILSPILDHTAARACQCVSLALEKRRGSDRLEVLDLVSDAGPHFRSYENAWYNCIFLPNQLKCQVVSHFGVEKHMKSSADHLFAVFETYVKMARAHGRDIIEPEDLRDVLVELNAEQRKRDPTAPHLVVVLDKESKKVPSAERYKMKADTLSITKTYCFSSSPASGPRRFGVKICNHIFASMPVSTDISADVVLTPTEDSSNDYRYGFWTEAGRSRWDTKPKPLGVGKETTLTRRQAAQQNLLPAGVDARFGASDSHTLIEKRLRQAENRQSRLETKKKLLEQATSASSSSSSSDADSSSSSGSS